MSTEEAAPQEERPPGVTQAVHRESRRLSFRLVLGFPLRDCGFSIPSTASPEVGSLELSPGLGGRRQAGQVCGQLLTWGLMKSGVQ